jgi:tyrosyl-tRNA synthetase
MLGPFSPNLAKVAAEEHLTVYLGVDPTARSLHAGNLLALMGLLHFHIRRHAVIALVNNSICFLPLSPGTLSKLLFSFCQIGGATGLIGDPGGRNTERPLLTKEALAQNAASITSQVHQLLSNATDYASRRMDIAKELAPPKVVNNQTWYKTFGILDFLRDVGRHARVHVMMSRDR